MGVNVRYLCDNGSTGHGYSGANGFPFAYSDSGTSPDDAGGFNYPIEVDFETLIKWWWRVKTWRLETDFSATKGSDSYAIPNGIIMGAPGTDELGRIDKGNYPQGGAGSDYYNIRLGILLPTTITAIIKDGSTLYPSIDIDFGLSYIQPKLGDPSKMFFGQTSSGFETLLGTIDGIDLPMIVDGTAVDSFNATQFDLIPDTYWPYAQRLDGAAIYDTSTGDVLPGRSPLN
jgi:hypothetical protein